MTIKQIAKLANVSTATVSYVINDNKNVLPETRKRVLDVIQQSGYQPNNIAKSLRMKNTSAIGVLVEDIRAFPAPPIVSAISEYAEQHKYHIILSDLNMLDKLLNRYEQISGQRDRINYMISWMLYGARVDAIIYVGMFDRDITGILDKINKPLIVAYSTTNDDWNSCVTYDNENISADVSNYLLKQGHTRIGVITGLAHTSPAKMRLKGIQRVFDERGLVLESSLVRNGDWSYESGYNCMLELLQLRTNLTAVFAMNDVMASGAINAMQDKGLNLPNDMSIVGFDNIKEIASYLRPSLSTVKIDFKGIGLNATKTAIDLINSIKPEEHIITVPCELIIRNSVRDINC